MRLEDFVDETVEKLSLQLWSVSVRPFSLPLCTSCLNDREKFPNYSTVLE